MADQEADGITLRIILDHLRAMEARMMRYMNEKFFSIDDRLQKLERKVDLLFVQSSNIDERLDDIEVVHIPTIKQFVSMP